MIFSSNFFLPTTFYLQVAELEFLTAPHKVEMAEGEEECFSWWLRGEEERLEESLVLVERTVLEGGYDGLLCFSQGAALGGLLARLQHRGTLQLHISFCILASSLTGTGTSSAWRTGSGCPACTSWARRTW